MQNKFLLLSLLVLSMGTNISYAGSEEKGHSEIKISDEAVKNYGIKTFKAPLGKYVTLPRAAFVASKDKHFVYGVDEDGGYIEIEAHLVQVEKNNFTFINEQGTKEFVVEGAKYLRMINLSLDAPATGHSH